MEGNKANKAMSYPSLVSNPPSFDLFYENEVSERVTHLKFSLSFPTITERLRGEKKEN